MHLETTHCAARSLPGTPPDLIHLLPSGPFKGRDGRSWSLSNPEAVIQASMSQGRDIVIDYEHQLDEPGVKRVGPIPAAGWITGLISKPDGIWGQASWTKTARNMIEERAYRYISPVIQFRPDAAGTVVRIKGASLVHRPNLELTALASQEDTMPDTTNDLSRVASALGLEEGADLMAVLCEIETRGQAPDPSKYVPIAVVHELMQTRREAVNGAKDQEAETLVDAAMSEGYLTPAMREWAVALCRQDRDSFDAFVQSATPAYAHLFRAPLARPLNRSRAPASDPLAQAICSQLGIDPGDLVD